MAKKTTRKPKAGKSSSRSASKRKPVSVKEMDGKQLVIVESPSKARNINQYLGPDYVVMASVGHVRDLPSRAPKGVKQPVPGVDLDNNFQPTYEILPGKKSTISDLKRLAAHAEEVWFATDLDREGEAIAWHLAEEMGIPAAKSKRVVFNAVTKSEIERAFQHPHPIDEDRVNAQQARRILDRIVGYQVSPLLWRKVARGLSAGRVQSVAVRLIVEREREIQAFIPDEYWTIAGLFAISVDQAESLAAAWKDFVASEGSGNGNGNGRAGRSLPPLKAQNAWLAEHQSFRAELFQLDGSRPELDSADRAAQVADRVGLVIDKRIETDDHNARGPAARRVELIGHCRPGMSYAVTSIETKRTTSRPPAPFITSTLQQAASTRIGFAARRTMRTAQQLYEGVDIPGRGTVGLITYMRTDSTHLSPEAVESVRSYIRQQYGADYLPKSANSYTSSNKKAQEAHEAIRPTDVSLHPDAVASSLKPDQAKLYRLVWSRYVACQMVNAQWDLTSILLNPVRDRQVVFRTTGRRLVFDGFYKVAGVPTFADEQVLPSVREDQTVAPFALEPLQKFTTPPARYTEASLVKTLEEEGIGRPSTYAEIIQKIQDRKYVEQRERRFFATDLGEVVTDKLIEAFPDILNVGFTRDMEDELDRIESRELDWTEVLRHFYGPFSTRLEEAHESLSHAKAETQPAPHTCEKCGAGTVFRFGKNGRFLSCARYPDCDYASPIDRDGNPAKAELVDIACLKCGGPMQKRSGRFGPFLGCNKYPECDGIIKLDRTGQPVAPQPPALETDQVCPKCGEPLYLRPGARGPWLSCSAFPKCRGRGAWSKLDKDTKARLQAILDEHMMKHPIPIIRDTKGNAITDERGKPIPNPDEPGAPVIPAPLSPSSDGTDGDDYQPQDEEAAMNAGAA